MAKQILVNVIRKNPIKRIDTYCRTNDEWHPNFEGDKVRVSLLTDMEHEGKIWHRVCVWGEDDDGMEFDFFGAENKILAEKMYKQVIKLPWVDKPILRKWGFTTA